MDDSNREFVYANGEIVGYLCKLCKAEGITAIMPTARGYKAHCTRLHAIGEQLEILPEEELRLTA
jgi:hypothetical protein